MKSEDRQRFLVSRRFHVALIRKKIGDFIDQSVLGLQDRKSQVLLVVTELLTNVVKHADRGMVEFGIGEGDGRQALVVVSDDNGPGIVDLEKACKEGYSTVGTLGLGFKVIANNSDFMELENTGHGLRVVVGWYLGAEKDRRSRAVPGVEFARVVKPMPGHVKGGDLVFVKGLRDKAFFAAVFDVLGHGMHANRSVVRIEAALSSVPHDVRAMDPARILELVHGELRPENLRGAVAAAGLFSPMDGILRLAMKGNITVALRVDGHFDLPVSKGGVLGEGILRVREYEFSVKKELVWAMASDGVDSMWVNLVKRDGLRSAQGIVEEAVQRNQRFRDDISMVVIRWRSN